MSRRINIGKREIGAGLPTFIIAEAGSNHNGSLDQAKRLVDAAAQAGVDAIKFQLFKGEKLYPKNCGIVDSPAGKIDFFEILKQMELPIEWLKTLKKYAEDQGLIFLCTCFDEDAADVLDDIGIQAHKLGSPELNHIPLLKHIANTQKPLILSTGLSTLEEVEDAVEISREYGSGQMALLHCVSAYPTPFEECNLNIVKTLADTFGVAAGISDHTLDPVMAPVVAVALGGCVIEKHFTLSKTLEGPDHSFALEPDELKQLVQEVRQVEHAQDRMTYAYQRFGEDLVKVVLGTSRKVITKTEQEIYPNDKRSIHAIADIKKGDRFTKENIAVLRSERNLTPGMLPKFCEAVLGKKANKDLAYSQGIHWDDLLEE